MPVHQMVNSYGNRRYFPVLYHDFWCYLHFHSNLELAYALEGECIVEVDGRQEVLHAGQAALLMPNQLHGFHTPKHSLVWVAVFSEEYVFQFASQNRQRIGQWAVFDWDEPIREMVRHCLVEKESTDPLLLKACFYAACQQYLAHVPMMPRPADPENLFGRISDYVSANFQKDITMKQMAVDLGFEYHYLSRRFHELFNINFRRFVNQHRINYANDRLMKNPDSIAQVAFDSGFQSVRSFNAVYKEVTGKVPHQTRRRV